MPAAAVVRRGSAGVRDQSAQALVLFRARRTPLEVSAHTENQNVSVLVPELGLDVDVEEVEALIAGQFGTGWAKQPPQELLSLFLWLSHAPECQRRRAAFAARRAGFCRARRGWC